MKCKFKRLSTIFTLVVILSLVTCIRAYGITPATVSIQNTAITVNKGSSASVVVQRAGDTSKSTTVHYRTLNGSGLTGVHFTETKGSITFNPGDISKTVSIPTLNASTYEIQNRFFFLEIYKVGADDNAIIDKSKSISKITINHVDTISRNGINTVYTGGSWYKIFTDSRDYEFENDANEAYRTVVKSIEDYAYWSSINAIVEAKFSANVETNATDVRLHIKASNASDGSNATGKSQYHKELDGWGNSGILKVNDYKYIYGVLGNHEAGGMYGFGGDYTEMFDCELSVYVTDETKPTKQEYHIVANLSEPYNDGDDFYISVKFNEIVSVDSGANPQVPVKCTDGSTIIADYIGGSGTDVLVFKGNIKNGKSATGLYFPSDNSFYGEGSIKDLAGNAMNDVAYGDLVNSNFKVQNTIPFIKKITTDKDNVSLNAGKTVDFTLQFSEPITITGTPILNLNNGAKATLTSVTGTKLAYATFRYTISNGGTEDRFNLGVSSITDGTIVDSTGNELDRTNSSVTTNIIVDTILPVITLSPSSGSTYAKSYAPKITGTDTGGSGINNKVYYVWTSASSRPADSSYKESINGVTAKIEGETGQRYLHIKVVDIAGNARYYDSAAFKLDNTKPSIALSKDQGIAAKAHSTIVSVSDSNAGSTGNFKYRWTPSSTIPTDSEFSSASQGTLGTAITKNIGDGSYYLHIRAEDKAGNVSYKTSKSFIFDNTAPSDSDIVVSNTNSSGKSIGSDNKEKSYTIAITAKDSNGQYDYGTIKSIKYQWKDGNSKISSGDTSWIDYTSPFDYSNSGTSGEKYLHISVTDTPGNEGYKTIKYTFDHDPPSIIFNSSNLTGAYRKVSSEISVTDNLNKLKIFKYEWLSYSERSYDLVSWKSGSINEYSGSNTTSKNDASGSFYLHVYAEDVVGNGVYKVSGPYVIDIKGPTGTINIVENVVGKEGTVTLKLSAIDNIPSNKSYYALSQDGGDTWSEWSEFPNEITISDYKILDLKGGLKEVSAKFKDVLGNESITDADTVSIDLTPPSAELAYTPIKDKGWTKEDVTVSLVNISDNLTNINNIATPNGTTYKFIDNGSYEFIVEDEVGNKKTIIAKVDWIDKIKPEITISPNSNLTPKKSHTATISVTDNILSGENVSIRYQWSKSNTSPSIDDKNWLSIEHGLRITKDGVDGEWYLHVKAADTAGNYNIRTSGKFIFDNIPPTGNISISGNYVNKNAVTVNLWSEDNYSNFLDLGYSLSINGSTWSQWQGMNSSNISINNYSIIDEEGLQTVYVKYKDKLNNESEVYTATVVLDKTGPTAEIIYSSNKEDGYINKDVTVELINISDAYTKAEDITVTESAFVFTANGEHTFKLRDKAGNETIITALVDWIDKTEPNIIVSPNSIQTPSMTHSTNITVADNISENIIINYQWTKTNISPSLNDANWAEVNNNEQVTINEGDGDWYLHIKAQDEAGNTKIFTSGKFVLDNTAPIGSININEEVTNSNAVTLYLSSNDEVTDSSRMKYSLSLDGEAWSEWSNLSEIVNNYIIPKVEGTTTIYVKYKDEQNNESDIYSDSVILDLTPPSAELIYSSNKEDGYVNTDVTVSLTNIQDNITESGSIIKNGTSYTFTTNGEYEFTIMDLVGNTSTIEARVDWIDKESPVIAPISGNQNPKKEYSAVINVTDNVTASSAITIHYQWTTSKLIPQEDDLGWISVENNSTVTKGAVDGEWYLHIKAQDSLGNRSFSSSGKFILDNTPPVGTVNYSTLNRTAQPVNATLQANELVTIANPVDGSNRYRFDDNGTFTFEFKDLAGNESSAVAEVDWIDKSIPTANVTLSTSDWTNENVEVIIWVPSESRMEIGSFQFDGITEYTLINEKVKRRELVVNELVDGTLAEVPKDCVYETAYSIGNNGKIIFEVMDVDTKIMDYVEITIDRIDKESPTYEIIYSEVNATKNDVVVGIIAQDNSNMKVEVTKPEEAALVDGNYLFSENGNYEFLLKDRAGNTITVPVSISNIDKVPPQLSISYSKTEWTSDNVTVAVSANEPIVVLNNNGSTSYEFSSNGEFQFEVRDMVGNISKIVAQVNNIDKVSPDAEVQYSPTNIVNTDVIIEVIPSEEVTITSVNDLQLLEGSTNKFIVPNNGTYEFKLIDRAGNESVKKIAISNIDKDSPVINYTLSITEATNKEVEVYLNGNEIFDVISVPTGITERVIGSEKRYFASDNGAYEFIVSDLGGNTGTVIVNITNIDKIAPTLTLSYSSEVWTNGDVTVTVSADEEITILNNEGKYSRIFTENGEFIFKAQDRAGNRSEITAVVSNIDKEKPIASISYSPTDIVNTDVVILVEAKEIVEIESLEGLELQAESRNKFIAKTNGKYNFKLVDRAGNENIQAVTINTIDKESPKITYGLSIEELTNKDVEIYIYSNEAYEVTYMTEGIREEVIHGNSKYFATENGSYTFRVKDEVGNEGEILVTVTNIDKVRPTLSIEYSTLEPTNEAVIATLSSNEEIVILNNGGKVNYEFLSNGEFTFNVKDLAGNEASITSKVRNIDKDAPNASITYSTTEMTNEHVIVTITGNEKLKSIVSKEDLEVTGGDEAGSLYTKAFKVIENGSYNFNLTDLAGNLKSYTINIINIDKEAPVLRYTLVYDTPVGIKEVNQDGEYIRFPDISEGEAKEIYEKSLITKNSVILNLNVNEEYKLINMPNNVSVNEDGSYKILENGVYTFIAQDLAGNSTEVNIEVDTIDKVKPNIELLYSTLEPTKEDVIVTVKAKENEYIRVINNYNKYSRMFTSNGEYIFIVQDYAGNQVEVKAVVNNIDKTPPKLDVIYSTTDKTNKNVTIEIKANEEFKMVNNEGSNFYTFENNGSIRLLAEDLIGNRSEIIVTVNNIDKIAPDIIFTGNEKMVILQGEDFDLLKDVTTTSYEDKSLPINVSGIVNKDVPGKYKILYSITDKAGNKAERERQIQILPKDTLIMTFNGNNPEEFDFLVGKEFMLESFNTKGKYTILYAKGKRDIGYMKIKGIELKDNVFQINEGGWYSFLISDQERNRRFYNVFIVK